MNGPDTEDAGLGPRLDLDPVERMRARGLALLDIQYETRATSIFRPVSISRRDYLVRLERALALDVRLVAD